MMLNSFVNCPTDLCDCLDGETYFIERKCKLSKVKRLSIRNGRLSIFLHMIVRKRKMIVKTQQKSLAETSPTFSPPILSPPLFLN